jgi:formylglycine-generating enzyme required for sulfatase activity
MNEWNQMMWERWREKKQKQAEEDGGVVINNNSQVVHSVQITSMLVRSGSCLDVKCRYEAAFLNVPVNGKYSTGAVERSKAPVVILP